MALAYLFSRLLRTFRGIKIADNPAFGAVANVIDHQLREGSSEEAALVAKEVRRLDLKAIITPVGWKEERKKGLDPKTLPNLEGLARAYRYRALGNTCHFLDATSLFFAHHQDDQYETVLMRLLGGHGYRGLQGIREANSIPECYDVHGVYKSGLIDDQLKAQPSLSFKPANREMKRLRSIFRDEKLAELDGNLGSNVSLAELIDRFPFYQPVEKDVRAPYLKPLDVEDGGVMIYRPLLEFDKDRLIATCEANKVTWFEDHTNKDPGLTTRNAVRYLVQNYQLPKALQKPSIIALAERSKRRTKYEEAEAHRFLVREAVIKDFDPNVGTLLVQLPTFQDGKTMRRRPSMRLSHDARKEHVKRIATIAVRMLIDFVTPEAHLPPLNNLEKVVNRLFPALASQPSDTKPRSFAMSGVLFTPLGTGKSLKWFLTRTPYTSNQPLPTTNLPGTIDHKLRPSKVDADDHSETHQLRSLAWKKAKLFDGRFWIRVGYSNRSNFRIQPFRLEHAKAFRALLPPLRRAKLERLLKHYAPGKTRFCLPALYCVERERDHYSQHVTTSQTLLALPSLGIHVPGLERWVRYEVRYRKVDTALLGHRRRGEGEGMGYYGVWRRRGRERRRRMYKYLERRKNPIR